MYQQALQWYLAYFAAGIIGFAILNRFLDQTKDKGYGISKAIGMLTVNYLVWLVSTTNLLKFNTNNVYIVSLLVLFCGTLLLTNKNARKIAKREILLQELAFFVTFALMLCFIAFFPYFQKPEDLTNLGIINGIIKSPSFPPRDTWLSGEAVNYYYFGHFKIAYLSILTKTPPYVAMNLELAALFANSLLAAVWVGRVINKSLLGGISTAFLLLFSGNLYPAYALLTQSGNSIDFSQATRLVPFTINDMPSYSFFLGGIHAHVMNLPYVITFIGILYYATREGKKTSLNYVLIALLLGSFYITNSWDFFIYTGLYALVSFTIKKEFYKKILTTGVTSILVPAFGIAMFAPYFFQFAPPVSGMGINTNFSGIKPLLLMFGTFIILLVAHLISAKKIKNQFVVATTLFCALLFIGTELFFLKDLYFFEGTDYFRGNTVYKVWYQIWILLSVSGGYFINELIKNKQKDGFFQKYKLVFLELLLVVTTIYPVFLVAGRISSNKTMVGLDGLIHFGDEREIIEYLSSKKNATIVEAYGSANKNEAFYSAASGIPTILGWKNHELGWRQNREGIEKRAKDVETIYTSNNAEEIKKLLISYRINYVVLGELEKKRFGVNAGEQISQTLKPMVETGTATLYEVEY